MKSNVQTYIDYFRQLAIRHTELRHDPASETGNGPVGSQHFASISVDEVTGKLRSSVGFPCLFIELYDAALESEIVYDIKEQLQGAFMVLDHPQDKTFMAESACYVRSERIVYDLLRQIYQEHYGDDVDRCNTPFREFYFDQLSRVPVGPICGGQFGYRVEFGLQLHKQLDITTAPEAGRFL